MKIRLINGGAIVDEMTAGNWDGVPKLMLVWNSDTATEASILLVCGPVAYGGWIVQGNGNGNNVHVGHCAPIPYNYRSRRVISSGDIVDIVVLEPNDGKPFMLYYAVAKYIDNHIDSGVLKVYAYIGLWIVTGVIGLIAILIGSAPILLPLLLIDSFCTWWWLVYLAAPAMMVYSVRIAGRILRWLGVDYDADL